jgi:hypothetical protein
MDYCQAMLKKDRVIIIQNGEIIEAIIFYYLTNDWEKLYKKRTWDVVDDEIDGKQIYVDKMVCKHVTKEIRKELQEAIEKQFPQVELGIYHRAPKDRCIKIWRKHELQHTIR